MSEVNAAAEPLSQRRSRYIPGAGTGIVRVAIDPVFWEKLLKKLRLDPRKINKPTFYDEYLYYDGDVNWSGLGLTMFPIFLLKVSGHFDCSRNRLTSLQGGPFEVTKDFDCSNNRITTFQGKENHRSVCGVGGNFNCDNNLLISLAGAPDVEKNFYCRNNHITAPKPPHGLRGMFVSDEKQPAGNETWPADELLTKFEVEKRLLSKIPGHPGLFDYNGSLDWREFGFTEFPIRFRKVEGDFTCEDNELTSLEGAPQEVGRDFDCSGNKLTDLKGAPVRVGGTFYCQGNRLTSLEGAPKHVQSIVCSYNNLPAGTTKPAGMTVLNKFVVEPQNTVKAAAEHDSSSASASFDSLLQALRTPRTFTSAGSSVTLRAKGSTITLSGSLTGEIALALPDVVLIRDGSVVARVNVSAVESPKTLLRKLLSTRVHAAAEAPPLTNGIVGMQRLLQHFPLKKTIALDIDSHVPGRPWKVSIRKGVSKLGQSFLALSVRAGIQNFTAKASLDMFADVVLQVRGRKHVYVGPMPQQPKDILRYLAYVFVRELVGEKHVQAAAELDVTVPEPLRHFVWYRDMVQKTILSFGGASRRLKVAGFDVELVPGSGSIQGHLRQFQTPYFHVRVGTRSYKVVPSTTGVPGIIILDEASRYSVGVTNLTNQSIRILLEAVLAKCIKHTKDVQATAATELERNITGTEMLQLFLNLQHFVRNTEFKIGADTVLVVSNSSSARPLFLLFVNNDKSHYFRLVISYEGDKPYATVLLPNLTAGAKTDKVATSKSLLKWAAAEALRLWKSAGYAYAAAEPLRAVDSMSMLSKLKFELRKHEDGRSIKSKGHNINFSVDDLGRLKIMAHPEEFILAIAGPYQGLALLVRKEDKWTVVRYFDVDSPGTLMAAAVAAVTKYLEKERDHSRD